MADGQFCGNCCFAQAASPGSATPDVVNCRRYPPVPYLDPENNEMIRAMFPIIGTRGWCGEWQAMGMAN